VTPPDLAQHTARLVADIRAALAKEVDALDHDATRFRARGLPRLAADVLALRDRLRALDRLLERT
jgi:hypothetical protein